MDQSKLERYEELGLREALNRPHRYPLACNELSSILRDAYSQLSKNLQSHIFHDTLLAFQLLPEMQTQASITAANALLHSVDAVLPKQKRILAAREFKHAMIAHKRRGKAICDEGGLIQKFHGDVLAHIFQFLDVQTLLLAALVCRSWREATWDNRLWQSIYADFLGTSVNMSNDIGHKSYTSSQNMQSTCHEEINTTTRVDWKDAFKIAHKDRSSKMLLTSPRGYCCYCRSAVWLNSGKCSKSQTGQECCYGTVKPVSTEQIVHYVLSGSIPGSSCIFDSDSEDSDSDDECTCKMWAFPMRLASFNMYVERQGEID
ncbi:unnamed protein product [Cuscuta epithymum]|uniref:F-box domain-containing protein n=1 Tax=Cuscuta epithymum TaxID=186058 RepID=A0AAV0FYX4_9ASTE|nr:unnamed protein product [Cuscuta epithymum]